MKSEEQSTTQFTSFEETELQKGSVNIIDNSVPRCPSNNQASLICLNPNCKGLIYSKAEKVQNEDRKSSLKTNIFICSDHGCKSCFYSSLNLQDSQKQTKPVKIIGVHAKCFVGDYRSLISCIEEKKKQSEPLKRCIDQLFEKFIDYLSELREKYISELNYYGLTQIQQKFLSHFDNKKYDQLTSAFCFEIVKQLDRQSAVNCSMAKAKLEEYWSKEQLKIKKSFEFIDKIIAKEFVSTSFLLEMDSKIVAEEQKFKLIQMLETQEKNAIESINLLYRASDNSFSAEAFHTKCDLRPNTVTVLETEFGCKIGGYTPLIWEKEGNNRADKDPTNKTFIFSLTNNHKFTLKQNHEAAILQYSSSGPTFGSGPSDIYIKDRANTTKIYGNIGNSYVNQEYQFGEQKSWTKFSGATSGRDFRAKEWEVFQVKWAEKL